MDYNALVVYLTEELHSLRKIHKHISLMSTSSHWDIFSEELVDFMEEISMYNKLRIEIILIFVFPFLECPYGDLVSADVSERFRVTKQRKLLIKFLISELLCNRLLHNISQLKDLEGAVVNNKNIFYNHHLCL